MGDRGRNPRIPAPTRMAGEEFFEVRFMRYREDWEKSKARQAAFWNGEILDRCCVSITAPRDGAGSAPSFTRDEAYYTDPQAVIAANRAQMERTYYAGDAFPCMPLDLGAGGHAGFFKGERHYIRDTVWFFPSLKHPDDLEFDETSPLYQKTLELARAFAQDSGGDYFISMPDSTGNADALSHLMGPDALMTAMLEEPQAVQRALQKIQAAYERIMKEVRAITAPVNEGGGCVQWLNTWAPGFHAQMQCDMSVMISPRLFDEFIAPELKAQSRMLDYALYHFDGVEQIRHLDTLLSIPGIRAIQWTQVAGQPPCTDYMPELQRIQRAGKGLIIHVSADQVETLMRALSSKGLYLLIHVDSQMEADELLRRVGQWSHD